MVDEPHLAAPLHVGVPGLLLPLLLPRAPGRGFLLSNPNEDHPAMAALFGRGTQQRLSDLLLVFFLGEVANGNTVGFGPAVDLGHIGFADLAEGGRRGNRKATLPMQKPAHLADGLQLGHVRLQEDAIDRATGQRDVVAQQRGIIGHRVALFGLEHWKSTSTNGTSVEVPFVQSWSARLRLFATPSAARSAHHAGARRGTERGASLRAEQRLAAGGPQGSPDPELGGMRSLAILASFRAKAGQRDGFRLSGGEL